MSESTTPAPRVACSRVVTISVRDGDRWEPLIRPVLREWPEDKAEALPAPSWEAP